MSEEAAMADANLREIARLRTALAQTQDLADHYRTQYNRAAEDLKTTRRQLADSTGQQHAMIEELRSVLPAGYRGDNPVWACEKVADQIADLRGQAQDANRLQAELEHAEERATQAQADNAALCAALADAVTCCHGIHYVDIDGEAELEACHLWITLDDRARATHAGEHPGAALLAELAAQRTQLDAAQARTEALQAEHAALRRWLDLAVAAWREERATSHALTSALRGLLAEPSGCPMCDAGTLRNPEKGHWPECPYAIARTVLQNTEQGEL